MPRNSAGVYTLPPTNPVVPFTTIATSWANPTLSDIGNELTNSLDRTGRGGMLAPFRIFDGTIAQPGLGFQNEVSLGLWRSASGTMQFTNGVANLLTIGPNTVTSQVQLNTYGIQTFKVLGALSWRVRDTASGSLNFTPSASVDGEDWDTTKTITFYGTTGGMNVPGGVTGVTQIVKGDSSVSIVDDGVSAGAVNCTTDGSTKWVQWSDRLNVVKCLTLYVDPVYSPLGGVPNAQYFLGNTANFGLPATTGAVDASVLERRLGGSVAFDLGIEPSGNWWTQARNVNDYTSQFQHYLNPNGGPIVVNSRTGYPWSAAAISVMQVGPRGAITGTGTNSCHAFNLYYNGASWIYQQNGSGWLGYMADNVYQIWSAPTGTAGAAATIGIHTSFNLDNSMDVTGRINTGIVTAPVGNGAYQPNANYQSLVVYVTSPGITFLPPTNLKDGQIMRIFIASTQNGVVFDAAYQWPGGVTPNFASGPNKYCIVTVARFNSGTLSANATMY